MGGLVAMELATAHPERCWALGLVATLVADLYAWLLADPAGDAFDSETADLTNISSIGTATAECGTSLAVRV